MAINITKEGNIEINSNIICKGQHPDDIHKAFGLQCSQGVYHERWTYIAYDCLESGNDKINISFRFYKEALMRIDFIPLITSNSDNHCDNRSDKEFKLKELYDEWLTSKIGKKRKFSWGEIESVYDSRSYSSSIVLIYE